MKMNHNSIIRPFLNVHTCSDGVIGRRSFLRRLAAGTAGAAALSLGWRDLLFAGADELKKQGKSMILLWMDGGPSQFETFNPKDGSKNQGPAKSISTALSGVQFAEFWPQMAKAAIKRSGPSNDFADFYLRIKRGVRHLINHLRLAQLILGAITIIRWQRQYPGIKFLPWSAVTAR